MNKVTIALESPTRAIRVKNLLIKSGIEAKIKKLDNSEHGCTHGVEISDEDLIETISILRSNNVHYSIREK